MKLLLDMNLPPGLGEKLRREGFEVTHWSSVGSPGASDAAVMQWARTNGYVVLTHDLDLSAVLAATSAQGPSVIQIRTQDVLGDRFLETLLLALSRFAEELERGAVVSIDERTARARILPLAR